MKQTANIQAGSPEHISGIDEFPPVRDIAGATILRTEACPGTDSIGPAVGLSVQYSAFNFGRFLTPAAARMLAAQLMLRADQAEGRAS